MIRWKFLGDGYISGTKERWEKGISKLKKIKREIKIDTVGIWNNKIILLKSTYRCNRHITENKSLIGLRRNRKLG